MWSARTANWLPRANDEITEDLLDKLRDAGVTEFSTLYLNDLDRGSHISQTLRSDETTDQWAARVAIYRMMRPGEPPTEDAVEALFQGLFYLPERYDLSVVGRMKFNRPRLPREAWTTRRRNGSAVSTSASGPKGGEGEGTLSNEDILAVVGVLVELRNGRGEIDDIDHLGNRRVRFRRRAGREPVPRRSGACRAGGQGASRPGRERQPYAPTI